MVDDTSAAEVVAYGIETYFIDRRAEFERHGATVYHAPMGMATLALVRKSALDEAREYGGQARLRERDAEDARVHLSLKLDVLKSTLDTSRAETAAANARAEAAERDLIESREREKVGAEFLATADARAEAAETALDFATFSPWLRSWCKSRFGKWITHNTAKGALAELRALTEIEGKSK